MKWYTAKCLFRVENQGTALPSGILGEFRYLLVSGDDENTAREKSALLAKKKEQTYTNARGGTTAWIFESIVELKEILSSELSDGTEVYSEYVP
jgi:hypothetical protein